MNDRKWLGQRPRQPLIGRRTCISVCSAISNASSASIPRYRQMTALCWLKSFSFPDIDRQAHRCDSMSL